MLLYAGDRVPASEIFIGLNLKRGENLDVIVQVQTTEQGRVTAQAQAQAGPGNRHPTNT